MWGKFIITPSMKQTQTYNAPATEAMTRRHVVDGPFLASFTWNLAKFLSCYLPQASSSRRDLLEGPLVDQRSVVGSFNGHCLDSVFDSLGSFFWGLLWVPLKVVPRRFQRYYNT